MDWELLFSDPLASGIREDSHMLERRQSVMEFQQLMKNDAQTALRCEMEKLSLTAHPNKREVRMYECFARVVCHGSSVAGHPDLILSTWTL